MYSVTASSERQDSLVRIIFLAVAVMTVSAQGQPEISIHCDIVRHTLVTTCCKCFGPFGAERCPEAEK